MPKYRVLDLPFVGAGAFTPHFVTNPMASSYGLVKISAAMGLSPIPVSPTTKECLPPISADRRTQGSYCAPDVILPDQYIAYADNMGPAADGKIGMAMRRHNPLPVPAMSWTPVPRSQTHKSKVGGRSAMAWPRAYQRYPTTGS